MLITKQIRHRCSVRGCQNTRTTLISRSRDLANGVYLCDDCIREAYELRMSVPAQTEADRIQNMIISATRLREARTPPEPTNEEIIIDAERSIDRELKLEEEYKDNDSVVTSASVPPVRVRMTKENRVK